MILLDMTEEDYKKLLSESGSIDTLDERLEAMKPLSVYTYVDNLVDNSELQNLYDAKVAEYDDLRKKYIDRFFSEPEPEPEPEPDDRISLDDLMIED